MPAAYSIANDVVYLSDINSGDIARDVIKGISEDGSTYSYTFRSSDNSVLEWQIVGLASATKPTLKTSAATALNAQRDAVKTGVDTQYASYVTTAQAQIDAL